MPKFQDFLLQSFASKKALRRFESSRSSSLIFAAFLLGSGQSAHRFAAVGAIPQDLKLHAAGSLLVAVGLYLRDFFLNLLHSVGLVCILFFIGLI